MRYWVKGSLRIPGSPSQHTEYNAAGQPLISIDFTKTADLFQHPDIFCRRVAIHNSLKSAAISPDGGGPPVNIYTSSRVVDVDVQSCTVFLENGSQVSGDCIIGADGVKVVLDGFYSAASPITYLSQ